jgi:hypothetical protein
MRLIHNVNIGKIFKINSQNLSNQYILQKKKLIINYFIIPNNKTLILLHELENLEFLKILEIQILKVLYMCCKHKHLL